MTSVIEPKEEVFDFYFVEITFKYVLFQKFLTSEDLQHHFIKLSKYWIVLAISVFQEPILLIIFCLLSVVYNIVHQMSKVKCILWIR